MQVCWEKDATSPLIHFALLIPAGSAFDPPGRAGLANLTARALLRGTRHRPRREFVHRVEAMGATLTARADTQHAVFRGVVLAESFGRFMKLVAEVFSEPAFAPRDVRELARLLEGELAATRQEPQYLAARALLNHAFAGTPLAHAPEGRRGEIRGLGAAEVGDFFGRYYRAAGVLLGLAGGSGSGTLSLPTEDRGPPPAPLWSGRRILIVEQDAMETTPLYFAVPGLEEADADLGALEVANFVFGEDFTSRLMRELRSKNGWTYGVSTGFRQLLPASAGPGFFSAYLFPSAQFAGPASAAVLRLFEAFQADGITETEFHQARQALSRSAPFRYATAEARLSLRLREVLTGRPYETLAQYLARLEALDLAAVNRIVRARVRTDRIWIAAAGEGEKLRPVLGALAGFAAPQLLRESQVF